MKHLIIFFSIIIFLFIFSCESAEIKKEKHLIDQVNLLHDVETMPKMLELRNLFDNVEDKRNSENSKQVSLLKKDLSVADDLMHNWMKNFNWPSDKTPIEERIKYLEKEVEKLEVMKDKMYSSMDNAKEFLKK